MKLRQAHITNFRSIVDSNQIDIENRVTVIIGKNEQGKTTLLSALASFNLDYKYKPKDLPKHLRPELEGKDPNTLPIVSLWLDIETSDKAALLDQIPEIEKSPQIKIVKYFANNYEYSFIAEDGKETSFKQIQPNLREYLELLSNYVTDLQGKLANHATRFPEFSPAINAAETAAKNLLSNKFQNAKSVEDAFIAYSTTLKGLPSQDEPIQQDIEQGLMAIGIPAGDIIAQLQIDRSSGIKKRIPHFALHSAKTHHIPNEVVVDDFVSNPQQVSMGMHNLCLAAGLDLEKVEALSKSSDTAQVQSYEDFYKASISGGLNEFWTQETYQVHFQIANGKLSVSISDGTYAPRIPPEDRSEGFQWYLSFYSTMLTDIGRSSSLIFLLDNPGLELHVDGQRDIKRFLEERISFASQVIYVTHSPALIDSYNLSQLRKVELLGENVGTKVSSSFSKEGSDFDLLEPVRSAIGTSIVASLIFSDYNVLVEGASDKPILEGALIQFEPGLANRITVNGSIAESKDAFIAEFYSRSNLPVTMALRYEKI